MNEQRRIDRESTEGRVGYIHQGKTWFAHISDMSNLGCRLTLSGAMPDEGDPLTVVLMEDLEVAASVIWREGDAVGVRFAKPVINAVVRFFSLPPFAPAPSDVTKDSFGRPLPPLGQGSNRR